MARQRTSAGGGKPGTKKPGKAPSTRGPVKLATLGASTRSRFVLYDLFGDERAYYQVERAEVEKPPAPKKKTLSHSILLIDRSGSMAPHVEDLKDTLLKLLTLDEYGQFDLLVTLISYAAEGDCSVHFQRRPIQKVMQPGSREAREIGKIEAGGASCPSQALQLAVALCRDDELTGITLHSDGVADDPSPAAEAAALDELCAELRQKPVFLNTIAYTDAADFRLLAKLANAVSGSVLQAGNIKELYDALYQTEKLLGEGLAPGLEIPLGNGFDYQVFVSHAAGKVNGAAGPLRIVGLPEDADAAVYKYARLSEAEFDRLTDVPRQQTGEAVFAFARARLAEGAVNTAKHALASTYDATLMERHGKALTHMQVRALAHDLDTILLFQPNLWQEHDIRDEVPVKRRISVLELAGLLDRHTGEFLINREHLKANYVRRGLRRVPGKRDAEGNLIEPDWKTEFTDKGDYVRVASFDINHNTANLNMRVVRPVVLRPREGGEPVREVAGIPLDNLQAYTTYTLVGDGELNVPELQIRLRSRELFDRLCKEAVLEEDAAPATRWDPDADYRLRLDNLPLVPPAVGSVNLDGVFDDLAEAKVLTSILDAMLPDESDEFTREQLSELRRHYLSRNLYVNLPTTTEHGDLQEALAEGRVDSRVGYKIDVGNHRILNLGKLMPANKFLDRAYEMYDADGRRVAKPTFARLLDDGVTVRAKRPSKRMKVTAVDEFMRRLFDDFLCLSCDGVVSGLLKRAGADALVKAMQDKRQGRDVPREEYVAALLDARRKLDAFAEGIYRDKVSPLVFFIGATGVLPDEMDTPALTAEQLTEKYPELTLSREESEGLFYELGETILSVYAETEYFSRS